MYSTRSGVGATGSDMSRILLVENDVFLLTTLKKYLSRENIQINTAKSLSRAFWLLKNFSYDLVVLDRVLDDGDGIKLIEHLHFASFNTRILMLTRKNELEDRLEGLRIGADDYLGKPFSLEELSLRIKNLLDKNKSHYKNLVRVGNLSLIPELGEVRIKKRIIRFTPIECRLLSCLFRFANRTVSRDFLLDEIWGGKKNGPNMKSVDVYIRRIRVKLGVYGKLITTKHGFGYKLVKNLTSFRGKK